MHKQRWPLRGKVILITGGAGGIGAATARELARRGAVPVLADIDQSALSAAAATIGADTMTTVLDVTDFAGCADAVTRVVERYGRLDGVWANAGIGVGGPAELVDPDAWTRVIGVNLIGAYHSVRAALPEVIKARGHVAITASLASFGHAPSMSAYSASKAGVEAFADSLRIEVAHQGVTVAVLHPTWIDTEMVREGERGSAAFALLRSAMRPPLSKTYPVDAIVAPIADAFEARKPRIFLPGFVRLGYRLRNSLNSGPAVRDLLKVAPEMRRLFAEQAEVEGARNASLSPRYR